MNMKKKRIEIFSKLLFYVLSIRTKTRERNTIWHMREKKNSSLNFQYKISRNLGHIY
jgi:hypothetical protein